MRKFPPNSKQADSVLESSSLLPYYSVSFFAPNFYVVISETALITKTTKVVIHNTILEADSGTCLEVELSLDTGTCAEVESSLDTGSCVEVEISIDTGTYVNKIYRP